MEIIKFKTNIASQEAVAQVAPFLDAVADIRKWKVDVASPDKVLSVSGVDLYPSIVEKAVQKAGYQAEILRVIGIGGADL
jgi:copper chaperone